MEIRHLKLVKCIVEEGTIAAASEKLFLTPGALSQQLKEAESQLGTLIFDRINKKMVLTKAGSRIYETAKTVLAELKKVDQEISEMIHGEKGTIRISTECYTSYHWLPSLIKRFQEIHPNIEVEIVIEATYEPIAKMLDGQLDLAITSDPINNNNVVYSELFQDEMLAIVSKDHSWANKRYILPQDFENENLIIHSLPLKTVSVYQFFLEPAGVSPKKIITMPLTEASVEMVKAGMAVFVMAKWAMAPFLQNDSVKAIRLGANGLIRTHYIAHLKNADETIYFADFMKFLKQEIDL